MTPLERCEAAFFDAMQPPPDLLVSDWADEYRVLSPEASAEPGRWVTARAEYQRGIMNSLNERGVDTIVIMSSAQVGKTELIISVIGYHIHQDPAPILCLQPTLEMAEAFSKDRIAPMLRDTPALQGRVSDARSRDGNNTLLAKAFPGGRLTLAGANSPASLASRPIRIVLCDEVDRYPESAGTEGDPVNLARKRTATFWNRKIILTSTPTIKGMSRIESAYLASDQRRYFVPCPHCGEKQTLKWSNVKWPENQPEDAYYVCEHCAAVIENRYKPQMLAAGTWQATAPAGNVAGFHLSELYSPWRKWGEVARDFLEAKHGGTEMLKTWVNTALGETWEDKGESLDGNALMARLEDYDNDLLPIGVVVCGVDVQKDRIEVSVVGFGEEQEAWLMDHLIVPGDTADPQVWLDLGELLDDIKPDFAAIDSGYNASQVYAFCQPRKWCRAIKGVSGFSKPFVEDERKRLMRLRTKRKSGGYPVEPVGVDGGKVMLHSRLKIAEPGPGCIHFPNTPDFDNEYFDQLTGEKLMTKKSMGRTVMYWQQIRSRVEAQDCLLYAFAALALSNIDIEKQMAAKESQQANARVANQVQKVAPAQQRQVQDDGGFGSGDWNL